MNYKEPSEQRVSTRQMRRNMTHVLAILWDYMGSFRSNAGNLPV